MLRQWLQSTARATRRALAWNLKDLSPPAEQYLFRFETAKDVSQWEVYSDSKYGGLSDVTLVLAKGNSVNTGVFSGSLSAGVAENAAAGLKRPGFVGIRTLDDTQNLDLEPFQKLAFRVKGDGRCYISSLRTESWVIGPTEGGYTTWQAFLFAPKDEWSTIEISLDSYRPTWRGKVLPVYKEMNLARIIGVGLSTSIKGPGKAVAGPGNLRLEMEWIKAIRTGP